MILCSWCVYRVFVGHKTRVEGSILQAGKGLGQFQYGSGQEDLCGSIPIDSKQQ